MAKSQRVETFEIPTEQLAYVPGPHGDRLALGRLSETWRSAVVTLSRPAPTALSAGAVPRPIGDASTTFRRMVELPGDRLGVALGAWWLRADHDDDHLHLGMPRPVADSWSLLGRFRRTLLSRWVPVELLLSPYHGRWTLLELMPRRGVRPGRIYYREGHASIDRFVAAIRAQERITRPKSPT
jgi:hypothetical protein